MITLVNYGLGNIQALYNIYSSLKLPVVVASNPDQLKDASKIILPGVGSFDWAMHRLNESGMRNILDDMVLGQKIPVLGICVGMQMMALKSDEGYNSGLGWINANVRRFEKTQETNKIQLPHMGWNDIKFTVNSSLFNDMENPRFYFLHSYYFVPNDSIQTIATTNYNIDFTCAVEDRNIYGVQFHPEKSHSWGIQLLKNFAKL